MITKTRITKIITTKNDDDDWKDLHLSLVAP